MPWSEEVLVGKADVEENRHHIIDLETQVSCATFRCFTESFRLLWAWPAMSELQPTMAVETPGKRA